jgi:hypothetical protein
MLQNVRGFAKGFSSKAFWMAWGLVAGSGCAAVAAGPEPGPQPVVEEFVLADTIQPVSAGQLDRAIARANSCGAWQAPYSVPGCP